MFDGDESAPCDGLYCIVLRELAAAGPRVKSRCVIAATEPAAGRRWPSADSILHALLPRMSRDLESRAAQPALTPAVTDAGLVSRLAGARARIATVL